MLWFDLVTPKNVMFFNPLIKAFVQNGYETIVTSRSGRQYKEIGQLIEMVGIQASFLGEYGGGELDEKFKSSLERQKSLLDFIQRKKPKALINLCSVDACRVAFALGIPIVNFCDLPSRGVGEGYTHVARLTLPLSTGILHPFCVPKNYFTNLIPEEKVLSYPFLDPILYLQDQKANDDFFKSLHLTKPIICYREEETLASYVKDKFLFAEHVLEKQEGTLLLMPRYDGNELKNKFPKACVLDKKETLSSVLPFIDLFVGGGGTMNIEACYWGIPTLSTRSFISYYDDYLIKEGLMAHVKTEEEMEIKIKEMLGKKSSPQVLHKQKVDLDGLVSQILKLIS